MADGHLGAGPSGPVWEAGEGCSFEEALSVGREVVNAAQAALPSLPRKDASRHFPATISDAQSLVHSREDAKKKQAANKAAKTKHKSLTTATATAQGHFPGAVRGGGDRASAFWLYMEDFFRAPTQEDLHDVLCMLQLPRDDPAYRICMPGKGDTIPPPPRPPSRPTSPQGQATIAAVPGSLQPPGSALEPPPGTDPNLDSPFERRSSRLVSKFSRGDIPNYNDLDDAVAAAAAAAAAEEEAAAARAATAAAAQAAAHAMTVPRTSSGALARSLWDVIPDSRLALLASELAELQQMVGVAAGEPLDEATQREVHATRAGPALGADAQRAVRSWLERQSAALSAQLGSQVQVPLLAQRRPRPGESTPDDREQQDGQEIGVPHAELNRRPEAALPSGAYVHPYTDLLLQRTVPQHVVKAATETPPAADIAPLAHYSKTPTMVGQLCGVEGMQGVGGSTPSLPALATPLAASALPAPPSSMWQSALSAVDMQQEAGPGEETPADVSVLSSGMAGGGEGDGVGVDQPLPSRPGSAAARAGGRQRSVNYALLAGKKDPAKTAAASAARKLSRAATLAKEAETAAGHPVAQAVAAVVAAAPAEGPALEQWEAATSLPALLAAAPQDEIAAETLALQAELAATAAANRARLLGALRGLLAELPAEAAAAKERAEEEAEIKAWTLHVQETKLREVQRRRDATHRDLGGAAQGPRGSPRPVLGHAGLTDAGVVAPYLGPEELYDVLAQRSVNDEAFCSVCGDGSSQEPNLILYCDRCDVAVHQRCYDVAEVPDHDWLCWPCRQYEEEQRAAGVPQEQIRSPHSLPLDRKGVTGGARGTKCALCPITCGAFRRTVDGQQWVHQTCANYIPETWLRPGPGPNVVEGLNKVPAKRWAGACDICERVDGAVINCQHPGTCQYAFHVMCARNCGLYLTVRADQAGRPLHRIYCAVHSRLQQDKDARAAATRAEDAHRAVTAVQDRAMNAAAAKAGAAHLVELEAERARMQALRSNMETCRIIVDQCRRREKIKRAAATLAKQVHEERLSHPVESLALLERLQALAQAGRTPGQQREAVLAGQLPAVAAAAGGGQDTPMPTATPVGHPAVGASEGAAAAEAMSGRSRRAVSRPQAITQSKRPRRGASQTQESPLEVKEGTSALAAAGVKEESDEDDQPGPSAKRARTAAGPRGKGAVGGSSAPSSAAASAGGGGRSGAGATGRSSSLPPIEKQALMSSAQVAALNSKLPPSMRYVLVEEVPTLAAGAAAPAGAPAAAATPGPAAAAGSVKAGPTTSAGPSGLTTAAPSVESTPAPTPATSGDGPRRRTRSARTAATATAETKPAGPKSSAKAPPKAEPRSGGRTPRTRSRA